VHGKLVAHQGHQPLDDREPQAQAPASVTSRVPDLKELVEYLLLHLRRDSHAGVDHFDPHIGPAAPCANDDASVPRISKRVGHEIGEHALDQHRVGPRGQRCRHEPHPQVPLDGLPVELQRKAVEQLLQREVAGIHCNCASVAVPIVALTAVLISSSASARSFARFVEPSIFRPSSR
jgi:hypothetical protein